MSESTVADLVRAALERRGYASLRSLDTASGGELNRSTVQRILDGGGLRAQTIERLVRHLGIPRAKLLRAVGHSDPSRVPTERFVLSVLAHTVCAALRLRLPGYHATTPDVLQRRFLQTGGVILNHGDEIVVRLNRRSYSPVLRQGDLPAVNVPGGADDD